MYYDKPALTITQQISLLQERGIIFEDINEAKKYFEHISYYKLSGYWHTFLEEPAIENMLKRA